MPSGLETVGGAAPLVSVVVTTYEHENYIRQALKSVLMQKTSFDYEVIVGDDCSNDGTREIVLEFATRYPNRVRTVLPDANLGFGGNPLFRRQFELARGKYVALLDGDDYWTSEEKLQRQVDYLENRSDCALSFHNVIVLYEETRREPHLLNPAAQKEIWTFDDLLADCFIGTCAAVMRRDAVGVLPDWFDTSPFGDWLLHLLAARNGYVGYLSEPMGAYRIHRKGVFSSLQRHDHLEQVILFYEQLDARLDKAYHAVIEREVGKRSCALADEYERLGDHRRARAWLKRCLRSSGMSGTVRDRRQLALIAKVYLPSVGSLVRMVKRVGRGRIL